ncbi:MAG: lysylphosphatidylglycerol synthase transmembrane domain-containing protein [Verrucomicrobia bacterium]|nr:lysylphosphatidylglycerol synthase transmembrane domain-containing protein [Verrucomicrobiota bacterium]
MKLKLWIGIIVSVLLMGWVLSRVNVGLLLESLGQIKIFPVLIAIICLLSTQMIKAWRWKYLMNSIKPMPTVNLLSPMVIGTMTDMILPARGGDVVRAFLIGNKEKVSKMATLATVVIERILDLATILIMCLVVLVWIPFSIPPEGQAVFAKFREIILIVGILCVLAVAVVVFVTWRGERLQKPLERFLGFLPERLRSRTMDVVRNFSSGLGSLKSGRDFLMVSLISMFLWSVYALSNFFILDAFSMYLPFYSSFILLFFQVLGVTLPSSPGFIGTYHAAVIAAFALLGVSHEAAVSVALVMHGAFFIPYILAGMVFLWMENLSIQSLNTLVSSKS